MEDRPTTTSATTTVQGGNNNDGNDRETCVMEDRPTTNQHGGMQLGNNNSITYKSCAITYITNITNNCKQCHQAEEHVVSADTPRDLMLRSPVNTTTSVRLVDCQGRELELGDVVSAERSMLWSIYAGDGKVIGLDTRTRMIVHELINVEEPFTSCSSQELSSTYSPMEIVQRAKFIADQRSPDGPVDFVFWCCTDMTLEEWLVYNGVPATNPEMVHLRRLNASESQTMPDKN